MTIHPKQVSALGPPTDVIRPPQRYTPISLGEIWRHRDLLMFLLLRDIRVTISGTRFGVLWLIFPPLANTLVLAIVLGYFLRVPSTQFPYPVLVLSGLAMWTYFSGVVNRAASSMLANSALITKVYFPRILIPGIPAFAGVVDLAILTVCLCAVAIPYGVLPRWQWVMLPVPMLVVVALALGTGIWASALAVRHRDFANALPVLLQIGLYTSPVLYPIDLVPDGWKTVYELNPMVGVLETSRWMLAPDVPFPTRALLISIGFALVLLVTSLFYFRRVEDSLSDLV